MSLDLIRKSSKHCTILRLTRNTGFLKLYVAELMSTEILVPGCGLGRPLN